MNKYYLFWFVIAFLSTTLAAQDQSNSCSNINGTHNEDMDWEYTETRPFPPIITNNGHIIVPTNPNDFNDQNVVASYQNANYKNRNNGFDVVAHGEPGIAYNSILEVLNPAKLSRLILKYKGSRTHINLYICNSGVPGNNLRAYAQVIADFTNMAVIAPTGFVSFPQHSSEPSVEERWSGAQGHNFWRFDPRGGSGGSSGGGPAATPVS